MTKNNSIPFKIKGLIWLAFLLLGFIQACEYQPYSQGKVLYDFHCANCHMQDGAGLRGLIPPLANADYLKNNQESLACVIRYGLKGTIIVNGKEYNTQMAGIPEINDVQITIPTSIILLTVDRVPFIFYSLYRFFSIRLLRYPTFPFFQIFSEARY